MRVAFIHDWLVGMRGGEKCLEALCSIYPDSDVFTFFYAPGSVGKTIESRPIFESVLGPGRRKHRFLLPFFALGVRDLEKQIAREHAKVPYDLVVSISHCAAKNVHAPKDVPHLCYCLTPPRYLWDQFERYFHNSIVRRVAEKVRIIFQRWDLRGARVPCRWISISRFVQQRLLRVYGKESSVIYPPVDVPFFSQVTACPRPKQFLVVNALVPYKNTDLIIEAFRDLPHELVIIGTGPEEPRLRALAGSNVHFVGRVSELELRQFYSSSQALVFAAEEDFGISPVEMQASGRPVIAYGVGGSLETVVGAVNPKSRKDVSLEQVEPERTGVFFSELSSGAIKSAVLEFLSVQNDFHSEGCRANAAQFSYERFGGEFMEAVETTLRDFGSDRSTQTQGKMRDQSGTESRDVLKANA